MARRGRKAEDRTIEAYDMWLEMLENAATDDELLALHEHSLDDEDEQDEDDDGGPVEDDYGDESFP